MLSLTYMESKQYNKLVNTTKKKQTHRYRDKLVVTSGEKEEERDKVGVGKKWLL